MFTIFFKVSVFFPRQNQKHEMVLVFAIKNKENIFCIFSYCENICLYKVRNNILFVNSVFIILYNVKPPIHVPERRTVAYRHKKRRSLVYESAVERGVSVTPGLVRGEKY